MNKPATRTQSSLGAYSGSSQVAEWQVLKEMAQMMVVTGFVSKSMSKPEQVVFAIMAGRELNMGPMWSVQNLQVIEGKIATKAEGQMALVYKNVPGAKFEFLQLDDKGCRIKASRPGIEPCEFGFTIEDATKAGLIHKDVWKKYTRGMLRSRAVSETCRSYFPDGIAGISSYTPEEIEDMKEDKQPQKASRNAETAAEDLKPLRPGLDMGFAFLTKFGITMDELQQYRKKAIELWDQEDYEIMRGVYKELHEGKMLVEDFRALSVDPFLEESTIESQ